MLEYDKNSSTYSGHFTKYTNVQYHKEEEDNVSSVVEGSSIITSSSINNNADEIQQPKLTTAVKKSSIFKKSKPFWKVRSSKTSLSTAKK